MGLYHILFGGSSKPRVTELEFKKVKSTLRGKGFSDNEIRKVEVLFSGDMYEQVSDSHPKGIENGEIKARIKWMRENKSKHGLSDSRIDDIEEALESRL